MSSVIERSITFTYYNASTYFRGSGSISIPAESWGKHFLMGTFSTSYVYGIFRTAAMDALYPNTTAHPVKCNATMNVSKPVTIGAAMVSAKMYFDGTEVLSSSVYTSAADYKTVTLTNSTLSAIVNSTKSSEIKFGLRTSGSVYQALIGTDSTSNMYITLYFNRYDFSASAGDSIASASVSSSTGYDGDSITYSCVLQSGAIFDGWYENGTRVSTSQSYTITVAGADKVLEARATGGQLVRKRYMVCGTEIKMGDDTTERFSLTYGNKTLISDLDGAKTLLCKDKIMNGNVHIGTRYAGCSGKIMPYHLVAMLCQGEWMMNTALNGGTSGTMSASGWCVTPYLPVPAGCTSITIEAGGTQNGSILHEYDAGLGYLSYWGGGSNPRTFSFDYPGQIKFVRATFSMANLAVCYIIDNTHGGYIYRGGVV